MTTRLSTYQLKEEILETHMDFEEIVDLHLQSLLEMNYANVKFLHMQFLDMKR